MSKKYQGLPSSKQTIVLDPGHGAVNNAGAPALGARSASGVREDDINLAMAKALRGHLQQRGYNVVLTHETAETTNKLDYNTSDKPRSAVGWRAQVDPKADLFLSLHYNANTENGQRQTTSLPVDVFSYDGKGYSGALAAKLASALNGRTQKNDLSVLKPWLHQPDSTRDRPANLIEFGNMNNPEDLRRALDPKSVDATAARVANAVDSFMKSPEAKAGFKLSENEMRQRAQDRQKDFAAGTLPGPNGMAATRLYPPAEVASAAPIMREPTYTPPAPSVASPPPNEALVKPAAPIAEPPTAPKPPEAVTATTVAPSTTPATNAKFVPLPTGLAKLKSKNAP